jgi:hypothetical protein
MRAVDDERDDPADGRIEEPVAEPSDSRQDDSEPSRDGRLRRDGDCPDRTKAPDVGQDHHPAALVPIGERAADQQRGQQAGALDRENEADLARAAIVNVFQPSAVRKAASPTSETAWPLNRSRKSRCRSAWKRRARRCRETPANIPCHAQWHTLRLELLQAE